MTGYQIERLAPERTSLPPQSLEGEQAVLGAMIIERSAVEKAAEVLKPDDFYRSAHKAIFETILGMWKRGVEVDLLTLKDALSSSDILDQVGGPTYLIQLTNAVPSAANIEYYSKMIEEKAIEQGLWSLAREIPDLIYEERETLEELTGKVETKLHNILNRRGGGQWKMLAQGVDEVFTQAEARAQNGGAMVIGLESPWDDYNYMTGGLHSEELTIVAARPGMGKSLLCQNIATHVASHHRLPVAVFSLEMSYRQVASRMICAEARVSGRHLRTGIMSENEWERVGDACDRLSELPVYIDDNPLMTINEIRSKCRKLMRSNGLGIVVVDYLQILGSDRQSGPGQNRSIELGEVAQRLKTLARELHVPVLGVSQLSRAVEQRSAKRPMLSDLRESGGLEAAADNVVFIYREDYYAEKKAIRNEERAAAGATRERWGEDEVSVAEIIFAKQREGSTGPIELAFHGQTARFTNLAKTLPQ